MARPGALVALATGDLTGDGVPEIVAGAKEGSTTAASIGYYSSTTPRIVNSWVWNPIQPVGWVMQLMVLDLNGDTFVDLPSVPKPAVLFLEQQQPTAAVDATAEVVARLPFLPDEASWIEALRRETVAR